MGKVDRIDMSNMHNIHACMYLCMYVPLIIHVFYS